MAQSRHLERIAHELELMDKAMASYADNQRGFYEASQLGQWDDAESHRLSAISYLESAMDAYTRSCRINMRA